MKKYLVASIALLASFSTAGASTFTMRSSENRCTASKSCPSGEVFLFDYNINQWKPGHDFDVTIMFDGTSVTIPDVTKEGFAFFSPSKPQTKGTYEIFDNGVLVGHGRARVPASLVGFQINPISDSDCDGDDRCPPLSGGGGGVGGAVPLPATWPLFATGLSLLAWKLRGKRNWNANA